MDNKNLSYEAMMLARECIENCKFDDALEQLELAQEYDPDNWEVFYELGRVYFELGNYESSISNYESLLEFHQSSIIYYNLAQSYEALGLVDKAIGNYIRVTIESPNFAPAYKKLGVLYTARGDKDDAIEEFENYIKLDIPEVEKQSIAKVIERLKNGKS